MKKIFTFFIIVTVFCGNAYASCDRVNLSQIEGLDNNALHRELCRYYKELRQQEKNLNSIRKNNKNYQSETYEICKEEVALIEQMMVKKSRNIPECP